MGGGLMQLVAYGAQDIYLTGNPQITFFKVVYRRHTNFSMETIAQTVQGSPDCAKGTSSTVTISRNGDLVHKVYVNLTSTEETDYGTCGSFSAMKDVELEIGGQRIDRHSGQWMGNYTELTHNFTKMSSLLAMTDQFEDNSVAQIPLQFWFCRNPGLALPLIALQYHEVKLKFQWNGLIMDDFSYSYDNDPSTSAVTIGDRTPTSPKVDVLCDYIYLDTDERRRFAQVSHEYLIEQVQEQVESIKTGKNNIRLNFNHPVKELIWTMGGGEKPQLNDILVSDTEPRWAETDRITLQLNGHDRFSPQHHKYFMVRQIYDYHTGSPFIDGYLNQAILDGGTLWSNLSTPYVYSFALKPEEHQPSGTCNFSRIDNAKLIIDLNGEDPTTSGKVYQDGDFVTGINQTPTTIKVFAVNYNVLRIMSGMGGLAYSN